MVYSTVKGNKSLGIRATREQSRASRHTLASVKSNDIYMDYLTAHIETGSHSVILSDDNHKKGDPKHCIVKYAFQTIMSCEPEHRDYHPG